MSRLESQDELVFKKSDLLELNTNLKKYKECYIVKFEKKYALEYIKIYLDEQYLWCNQQNLLIKIKKGEEFEEFIIQFAQWYQEKYGGEVACGVGIRTDESLNRFRTIAFQNRKTRYKGYNWTTQIKQHEKHLNVYNFYPIYDWSAEDIWGAVSQLDLKFNYIYELMYKNGVTIYEQRLCQPYGDDQRNGLNQFKALEYETWSKVLNRVNRS